MGLDLGFETHLHGFKQGTVLCLSPGLLVLLKQLLAHGRISRFALFDLADTHDRKTVGAHQRDEFLLPEASVQDILAAFDRSEADVLVVVDRLESRSVIGTVSEAHVLRTYTTELERRNQEVFFR